MNLMTTGAIFDRAAPIRAGLPQDHRPRLPAELQTAPYAFLTARDLRGLVAAMVD